LSARVTGANESEPLPAHLSPCGVSAVELEPLGAEIVAAADVIDRARRCSAALLQRIVGSRLGRDPRR
jgi:hypothetical protein